MKVQMTETLQSIIIAVQNYRMWRYSDMYVRGERGSTQTLRVENDTYRYFVSLDPKKAGLDTTRNCLEAVLSYPITETITTEMEDLPKRFSFGW